MSKNTNNINTLNILWGVQGGRISRPDRAGIRVHPADRGAVAQRRTPWPTYAIRPPPGRNQFGCVVLGDTFRTQTILLSYVYLRSRRAGCHGGTHGGQGDGNPDVLIIRKTTASKIWGYKQGYCTCRGSYNFIKIRALSIDFNSPRFGGNRSSAMWKEPSLR
jgi:hypothetical protein